MYKYVTVAETVDCFQAPEVTRIFSMDTRTWAGKFHFPAGISTLALAT